MLKPTTPRTLLASLYRLHPDHRPARPWLIALSVAMLVRTIPFVLAFSGYQDREGWLQFAPCDLTLLWGPVLWIYVSRLTHREPDRRGRHVLPAALHVGYQVALLLIPLDTRLTWYVDVHRPVVEPLIAAVQLISLSVYGAVAWKDYSHWRSRDGAPAVAFDEPWRVWMLRTVLGGITLTVVGGAIMLLVHVLIVPMIYLNQLPIALAYAVSTYAVTVLASRAAQAPGSGRLALVWDAPAEQPLPPPRISPYVAQADDWRRRVVETGWYRDSSLTLTSLATRLQTSERTLSRTLREGAGQTFSSFVNQLRVEEAAARLADPATPTVLEVAFAVGFASKASFHRAFKQFRGRTPTAFRAHAGSQLPPIASVAEREATP